MREGDVVQGTITAIKPYGAFVDVDGRKGLVHISEVVHGYVYDIEDFLQQAKTYKFKVLSIDEEGRLSLSRKALKRQPRRMIVTLKEGFAPLKKRLPHWIREWHGGNPTKETEDEKDD